MIYRMRNPIQNYAWGSRTLLRQVRGLAGPAAEPEAEMWMGAHPNAPSEIEIEGKWVPLTEALAAQPRTLLGEESLSRFGPGLPFLFKVLCAETPLSLQAHPSQEQAQAGFARDEAAGLPRNAPNRNYKDANHKPELLCALTPFDALCGFRAVGESLELAALLELPALQGFTAALESGETEAGYRALVRELLSLPAADASLLMKAFAERLRTLRSRQGETRALLWENIARLLATYPTDAGVVLAVFLNWVHLEPFEALYLPAGQLHAYVGGAGVELMANSDNVLRGGMTPKHVDVPELCAVLACAPTPVPRVWPGSLQGGQWEYQTPAQEFCLHRVEAPGDCPVEVAVEGPEVLLSVCGEASLEDREGAVHRVGQGESLFIAATGGGYSLTGNATLFRATVGH